MDYCHTLHNENNYWDGELKAPPITPDEEPESEGNSSKEEEAENSPETVSLESTVYNTRALDKFASTYQLETFEKNFLVIFNQENIDGYLPRDGTEKDVEALRKTFSQFGFEIHEHKDFTKDEIMEELKVFNEKDFTDYGCIAVVVLTHGTSGGLIRAKDMQYSETEIIKHFKTVKNITLITKPKLLIVQACRGTGQIKGVVARKAMIVHKDLDQQDESYTLPMESDILVLHSTYPGNPSHRVNLFGSWFIQTLCYEINKNARKRDLETIITYVKRKVAIDMGQKVYNRRTNEWDMNKQMPVLMSTLIRKLYLRKFGQNPTFADDKTEDSEVEPPSPMLLMPCSCYLDHFVYLQKCLRYIVEENPEDKQAKLYLDLCDTFGEGCQFNESKEKMTQLISEHLSTKAQHYEYFKYLYISTTKPIEES